MDVKSSNSYPSSMLSNFHPHTFTFRGTTFPSMESLLQGIKSPDIEQQNNIFKLVGLQAKRSGKPINWYDKRLLYFQGQPIDRFSQEYQNFLDEAFEALSQNKAFRKALLDSGNEPITHSIGRSDPNKTVLTEQEFVSRLMKLRNKLQGQSQTANKEKDFPDLGF